MHKTISILTFVLIGILFSFSCGEKNESRSELTRNAFDHDGLRREYLYYAPPNLIKNAPLVVVLHGFTSTAEKIMAYSGMNGLAEQNNFAVVYPQGTKDHDLNTFWNVGYEFHADNKVDDLDFITKLLQYLQKNHSLSQDNTFITGMSNGGEMCYLISCQHADMFKAVAPVAGTMMSAFFDDCIPSRQIPIFAVVGTNDTTTNYLGDVENKEGWGAYESIPDIIDFWANSIDYDIMQIDTLPDLVKEDSSFVISQKYLSRVNNIEILYYQIVGGGHDWPGAWGNEDINASDEIWNFFRKYIQ